MARLSRGNGEGRSEGASPENLADPLRRRPHLTGRDGCNRIGRSGSRLGAAMKFEIERTMLRGSTGPTPPTPPGVETFIVLGDDLEQALGSVLARDHAQLDGAPVALGEEAFVTARNDRGLWLLRLHLLDRS